MCLTHAQCIDHLKPVYMHRLAPLIAVLGDKVYIFQYIPITAVF